MQLEQDIPASALVRVYLLGPLEIWKKDPSGTWKLVPKDQWKTSKPARRVFKRLLAQPGRRLSRGRLQDDIWPDTDFELADKYLYTAISIIHGITGKELVKTWEASYELAGQSVIWTDIDTCEYLLKAAENQGHTTVQALPLLEQALVYLERGEYLEREEGVWCHNFRTRAEDMLKQCRSWLAEAYEAQGKYWQAGEQYRALCQSLPPNENALRDWMAMLVQQGKAQEALKCYQEMKAFVEAQGFFLSNELEHAVISSLNKRPYRMLVEPPQILQSRIGNNQTKDTDIVRRQLLQNFLGIASVSLFSGGTLQISMDMLPLFATLTDTCRQLSEGNELTTAEHILWSYLPKIELLARIAAHDQKSAANIASQGYLLAASLVGHRNDLLGRLNYSEQALRYGELAGDLNLQVVAIRQIAISFDCMARSDKVLETYQQMLPSLNNDNISPLLRACIYADISGAHASLLHEHEASHFLDLAYESFPEKLENEPPYLATICRYSSLVFWEGVNHLSLHHPKSAEQALCRMLQPETQSPERNRVEALNYRVEALIELRDLEQTCACLEAAVKGAIAVGSTRRYQQGYDQFQHMQQLWRHEKQVQRLTDLFRA
ncbi:MAG TPA: BTAD domain-containing putative transcriptional regulator [Ktedonobacteraceae bacterium]|nr:BTAD domain-containing putative transcriptional regulator [Ktedonobacteraceae bacterium]